MDTKSESTKHTPEQIGWFRKYEKVRRLGRFNMFDPRARKSSGLSPDEYNYVMQNFETLHEQGGAA